MWVVVLGDAICTTEGGFLSQADAQRRVDALNARHGPIFRVRGVRI